MGTEPGSTCGTRSTTETVPGTHVLDPAQDTIKQMCIIKKMHNEWQMDGMNEWLGINKGRKWLR
jgi:hypothetical protein